MMCGLLFAYGCNILHGQVFTARQVLHAQTKELHDTGSQPFDERRFVNVFTLKPPDSGHNGSDGTNEAWARYLDELEGLFCLAGEGNLAESQGRVARRVASVLHEHPMAPPVPGPMDVEIDNTKSNTLTVLHISAEDTPGFLYELTNSLSLLGYDIRRVILTSLGNRAVDTLFIVGPGGEKITDPEQQTRLKTTVVLVKHFMQLLPDSPDPARALLHIGQFLEQLFELPDWSDKLASLDRSVVLEALSRLLGVSDFLWEDFLRVQHDNLFPVIRDIDGLAQRRPRSEIDAELTCLIAESDSADECRQRINDFKDREMFRVDMRHIAGHIVEFGQFSAELTDVAECVVQAAVDVCRHELVDRYGTPCTKPGDQSTKNRLTVLALGKAGSRELGFASDIELMFVYAGAGHTDGPCAISTAEFYIKLVEAFTHTIQARRRGIFEIDLRLRPFGNAGPLAVSQAAFEAYFAPTGPAWPYERQALVKLRPIAGDPQFGCQLVELRDRLVYTGEPFDVAAMRGLREQQVRQLVQPGTWNAKLSAGGLVDCEYLVQALQISHGQVQQSIRLTNTQKAIRALHDAAFLSDEQSDRLRRAHVFLRRLIDALRIVRGDARDLAVPDPVTEEFEFLARRLGYGTRLSELSRDIESTAADVADVSRLLDRLQ